MSVSYPKLREGGTIGIVSPGRWPKAEWLEEAKLLFKQRGYKTVIHPQNYLQDGQLAGPASERAAAIMDMFTSPDIDAIWCSRGGTGTIQLLDKLDYDLIVQHEKPFIGFSDITFLLQAIALKAKFPTFHGPLLWNFAQKNNAPRTIEDAFAVLTAGAPLRLSYPDIECMRAGEAKGVITGGNLTMLQHLIGTAFDWDATDAILFIEDCDEVIYKMAQRLQHLKLAGKLTRVRAVLVGEMTGIADGETGFAKSGETVYGRSLRQILLEVLPENVPLCFNFPCGHGNFITTLPLMSPVHLTIDKSGASIAF